MGNGEPEEPSQRGRALAAGYDLVAGQAAGLEELRQPGAASEQAQLNAQARRDKATSQDTAA
jgi:hypothetical protein